MKQPWMFLAGAGVCALVAVGLVFAFVRDDGDGGTGPPSSPEPTATTVAGTTPRASPTPIPVVFEVTENFGMLLPGRLLEARPESAFPAWVGTNAVIYDTQTGRTIDLGPGDGVSFSPDGKHAAWNAGNRDTDGFGRLRVGEMRVVALETGNQHVIGHGVAVIFPDNERLALQLPRSPLEDAKWQLLDIDTLQPSADQTTPGPTPGERITSTGHILKSTPDPATSLPRGGHGTTHFELLDPNDRHIVMEFDAYKVVDATATELVVASAWTEIPNEPFKSHPVFLHYLDVTTGHGKLFAFADASTPNWPLSADGKHVVWTNGFCSEDGHTQVMLVDRASGMPFGILREGEDGIDQQVEAGSDEAYLFLTPTGLIAEGTFGATALIDPVTMQYAAVLPPVQLAAELKDSGPVQPTWSEDYRYAAYWQGGGHGGLC